MLTRGWMVCTSIHVSAVSLPLLINLPRWNSATLQVFEFFHDSLDDERAAEHVHATRKGNFAGLGWLQFDRNRRVERQLALDTERRNRDFCCTRGVGRPHERDTRRYTRAKREARRLETFLRDNHT